MAFSVVRIENTFIRRATLLVLFVPVVVIGTVVHMIKVTWDCMVESEKAFRSAWRGW